MIEDGVIFLVIAERTYPRKLIFSYLNDVHRCFVEELVRDHGEGWRQAIDTAARAYCFIKFGELLGAVCRRKTKARRPAGPGNCEG